MDLRIDPALRGYDEGELPVCERFPSYGEARPDPIPLKERLAQISSSTGKWLGRVADRFSSQSDARLRTAERTVEQYWRRQSGGAPLPDEAYLRQTAAVLLQLRDGLQAQGLSCRRGKLIDLALHLVHQQKAPDPGVYEEVSGSRAVRAVLEVECLALAGEFEDALREKVLAHYLKAAGGEKFVDDDMRRQAEQLAGPTAEALGRLQERLTGRVGVSLPPFQDLLQIAHQLAHVVWPELAQQDNLDQNSPQQWLTLLEQSGAILPLADLVRDPALQAALRDRVLPEWIAELQAAAGAKGLRGTAVAQVPSE